MADDTIQVSITLDDDGLKNGLADAQKRLNDLSNSVKSASEAGDPPHQVEQQTDEKKGYADQVAQVQMLKALHQISADEEIADLKRLENARDATAQQSLNRDVETTKLEHSRLEWNLDGASLTI
jgi:hypothetical protein